MSPEVVKQEVVEALEVKAAVRLAVGHTDWRAFYGTADTRWHRLRCWWRDRLVPALRRPLIAWRHRRAKEL